MGVLLCMYLLLIKTGISMNAKCQKLKSPYCQFVSNYTVFPNSNSKRGNFITQVKKRGYFFIYFFYFFLYFLHNLIHQAEVDEKFEQSGTSISLLLEKSCHEKLHNFACMYYFPVCAENLDYEVYPCRELCLDIKQKCMR